MLYEVITVPLPAGELGFFQAEHGHHVVAEDKDGAVGPPESLFFEVHKGIRHEALAEAVGHIAGRIPFLENAQPRITSYNVCYTKLLRKVPAPL